MWKTYAGSMKAVFQGGADLVTYWFEKARVQIAERRAKRVGLLATNSIRQPQNRRVLAACRREQARVG